MRRPKVSAHKKRRYAEARLRVFTKTGVAVFVPKLAFTGESSSLQRWQFLLTENLRFCAFLPQIAAKLMKTAPQLTLSRVFDPPHGLGSQLKSPLISVFMSRFSPFLRPPASKSIAENFIHTLHYVNMNHVLAVAVFSDDTIRETAELQSEILKFCTF